METVIAMTAGSGQEAVIAIGMTVDPVRGIAIGIAIEQKSPRIRRTRTRIKKTKRKKKKNVRTAEAVARAPHARNARPIAHRRRRREKVENISLPIGYPAAVHHRVETETAHLRGGETMIGSLRLGGACKLPLRRTKPSIMGADAAIAALILSGETVLGVLFVKILTCARTVMSARTSATLQATGFSPNNRQENQGQLNLLVEVYNFRLAWHRQACLQG